MYSSLFSKIKISESIKFVFILSDDISRNFCCENRNFQWKDGRRVIFDSKIVKITINRKPGNTGYNPY